MVRGREGREGREGRGGKTSVGQENWKEGFSGKGGDKERLYVCVCLCRKKGKREGGERRRASWGMRRRSDQVRERTAQGMPNTRANAKRLEMQATNGPRPCRNERRALQRGMNGGAWATSHPSPAARAKRISERT